MRRKNAVRILLVLSMALGMGIFLTACDKQATPQLSCAFVYGSGEDRHDSKLHGIGYPGDTVDYDDAKEVIRYAPCGPRNYIINDGKIEINDEDGKKKRVGDRFELPIGYTESGTPVKVALSVYWTLNQNKSALTDFAELCLKYNCFSDEDQTGDSNFATPGWNGLLGENLSTAIDASVRAEMPRFTDDIWLRHDPKLYEQLGEAMSREFANKVRAKVGYTNDLFCGSGNSRWDEKHREFRCTQVRVVIDGVDNANAAQQRRADESSASEREGDLNTKRLEAAKKLYGEDAGRWLGLQDTIEKCTNGKSCTFNIGDVPVTQR